MHPWEVAKECCSELEDLELSCTGPELSSTTLSGRLTITVTMAEYAQWCQAAIAGNQGFCQHTGTADRVSIVTDSVGLPVCVCFQTV